MHIGLGDLHNDAPYGRIQNDIPGGCLLANHLPVHLAFGRHVDNDITLHLGLTAQPAACFQTALFLVALLNRIPGRQRILCHIDPMLGERADAGRHLTF